MPDLALKPCPFCGGEKIREGHVRDGRRIYCADCSASVTAFHPNASDSSKSLWNCRPTELSSSSLDILTDLRLAAAGIREYLPLSMPTGEDGKIHFSRALADAAAESIEAFLSTQHVNVTPPIGIAREAYGVKIEFVADCLRNYAQVLRSGQIDGAGHCFPADMEEAADMLDAGEIELLNAATAVITELFQTPEHIAAMNHLRDVVERRA